MTLKYLLIAGAFGVFAMSGTEATTAQTLASQEAMGKVELIKSQRWCARHPYHHKCHRHHRHHHHHDWPPFHRYEHKYDDRYNNRESFCRQNPFGDGCQRFCMLNPGTCSMKGRYR